MPVVKYFYPAENSDEKQILTAVSEWKQNQGLEACLFSS